jgi:4-diphosphocytidyl-2-C-methyl-D-erythritol kinase
VTITINAHAKINPFLWVGPLRADGYHEIETVLQAVSLCDTLTFSPAQQLSIRCSDSSLDGDANLVAKAYRLSSEIADLPPLDIYIDKRIPSKAGLGGGSSDAASALRAFDYLSKGALTKQVSEIALACGSDVPFFLGGSTRAIAKGRGERLQPLQAESRSLIIAKPANVASDTKSAYGKLDAIQNRPLTRPDIMPYNDFERVAPCESLEVIDRLRGLGLTECGLCGSGSAVYGVTQDSASIAAEIKSERIWVAECQTITSFGEIWTQ